MTPDEFRAIISRLGVTQGGAARLLGVDGRTTRRWIRGDRDIPPPVQRLLWAIERDPTLIAAIRDHWLADEDEQPED